MTERRYASPRALETAITAKATAKAEGEAAALKLAGRAARDFVGQRINQLQRDVAFHAVLRRLARGSSQGVWVIKGGVALQLRLDPSRPSKDIDVAWLGDAIDRAAELKALRIALQHDDGDFFEFQLDLSRAETDEDGALVLPLGVLLGGRRFERFSIDLAPAREGIEADQVTDVPAPLDIDQLGSATVRVLQVELQLADKLCAITKCGTECHRVGGVIWLMSR